MLFHLMSWLYERTSTVITPFGPRAAASCCGEDADRASRNAVLPR